MTSNEIRKKFLDFFQKRGHAILPSTSLVPVNDRSVLFNTAGMQPLVPNLLGEMHPLGKKLASSQKCVRTVDIDGIGDNTHVTFFEMLGNWSLGDYWKKEAIEWSYEFLTSPAEGLGLNPDRLFVTCFGGDENASRDEETAGIWREVFNKNNIKGERIYFRSASTNWWPEPKAEDSYSGPTGPDTEMYYGLTGEFSKGMTLDEYIKADEEQKVVEVWNDVFMEYMKKGGKVIEKLHQQNVDTCSGLERLSMVVQGKTNLFDTDIFSPAIVHIRTRSLVGNITSERILADHIRTSVFLIADGVSPSNTDRGYVLRRLLRRAVQHADILGLKSEEGEELGRLSSIASFFIEHYSSVYPNIALEISRIYNEIENEEKRFKKVLDVGLKEFQKLSVGKKEISTKEAFNLYSSRGVPIDLIVDLAKENNIKIDKDALNEELKKHKDSSREGSEQKFKGGISG